MATSLVMATTSQAGDTATRSITHIDPTVTNAKLKTFAEGMNGLTNNTLSDARRVDTTSLIKDTKLDRNLQLSQSTIAASNISMVLDSPTTITLSGADISLADLRVRKPNENNTYIYVEWVSNDSGGIDIELVGDAVSTASTSNIVFEVPETSNYEAASVTLSITNG